MPTLTLNAVERRIAALQKLAQSLKQKSKAPAVKAIRKKMAKHHVSLEDLRMVEKPAPRAKKAARSGAAQAEYQDPATGKRWAGRGRTPGWIKRAEAEGQSRERFRVI
jgi:DNA-binding protein H-NS